MTDEEARELVNRHAPKLSPAESQFVRVIGRHETRYARGWKDNSHIPGAVGDPRTSHNWGAINALADQPFFSYEDGLAGQKEVRKFRVYPDDGFGIRDLARTLYVRRPGIKEAIANSDGVKAVTIMSQKPIYFEAPLAGYIKAAKNHYDEIIKNTGEPRLLNFDSGGTDALLAVALIGGSIYALNKWL